MDKSQAVLNIEQTFPLRELNELAEQESHNKHFYRPATYVHKWWARRLGSVFREVLLRSAPSSRGRIPPLGALEGLVVYDPFAGSGTTLVEAVKLGETM